MNHLKKVIDIPCFILYYFLQLCLASLYLLRQIVLPAKRCKTSVINIPVNIKSNAGLLIYTNLISMSPGTLTLDMTDDKKMVKVHILSDNSDKMILARLKNMQRKIDNITR